MECEINKKKEEINEAYADLFDSIDEKIKKLEKEKEEINIESMLKKGEAISAITGKYGRAALIDETLANELSLVINEKEEFIYPEELIGNQEYLVGCLNSIQNPFWDVDDEEEIEEREDEIYGAFGITKEGRPAFRQFVNDNIDIIKGVAIVPMESRNDYYPNGGLYGFERIEEPIICKAFPKAVLPESVFDNLDELLAGLQPDEEDEIKYSGAKYSRAVAKVKIVVYIVRLKSLAF